VSNVGLANDASDILQGKAIPRYQAKGAAGASAVTGFTYVHKYWTGLKKDFSSSKINESSCGISISNDGVVTDFLN